MVKKLNFLTLFLIFILINNTVHYSENYRLLFMCSFVYLITVLISFQLILVNVQNLN